jgi:hypothetical protein
LRALGRESNVLYRVFAENIAERPRGETTEFLSIMDQKMGVIQDAWEDPTAKLVIYLDANMLVVGDFVSDIRSRSTELILSPKLLSAPSRVALRRAR